MKKVLRAIILCLLAVMMALPMTAFADDATITGYAFDYDSTLSAEGGYRSKWVGSTLATSATYANWVKADGSFNGPLQWSPGIKSKVTLDDVNGVLTFKGVAGDGNIQINPVENNKIAAGVTPFFIAFDTKPDADSFAGMSLSAFESNSDHTLCWIDTDGKVYWGTTAAAGGGKNSTGKELVMGEWNTVMIYIIPRYSEDDATVLTGYTAYIDVLPTEQCVKGWGITETDIKALSSFDWSATKVFTNNNAKMLIKGYQARQDETDKTSPARSFNLHDFRLFRMKADQPLYRVSFDGHPELTAYVPQASNGDTGSITVPGATGVSYWVSGTGTDAEYLTPGDTKKVVASKVYSVATGDQEAIATLMAAVSRLDETALADGEYTYAEMKASRDEITQRLEDAVASGAVSDEEGGANYAYYEKATQRLDDLETYMQVIADNGDALIAAASIFSNDDENLDDRIAAYEEVKDLPIDETYSDEARDAKTQLDIFTALYLEISEPYRFYKENKGKLLVDQTDEELRALLKQLIDNITIIKDSGATFTPDRIFFTKYEEYLTNQSARVKAAGSVTQKYTELERLVLLYNAYNAGIGKSKTVAPAVQEAINDYNSAIARINAEIVTATKIAASCSLEVTQNTAFGKFIGYATATVNRSTPLTTKSKENEGGAQ